jgi:LDH2 family malate/lactate/ureidoglycolate dehydrogenase
MIVSATEEHELILAVLGAHGALPETATVQAHWLVEATCAARAHTAYSACQAPRSGTG